MTAAQTRDAVVRPEVPPRDGLCVLIVDDDPELADSVAAAFKRAGSRTIVALDPSTARARFNQDHADLVVLDLHLGAWSGFDVLREFRASSDVPIVVLTARDSDEDRTRGLSMGADDYLSKPFDERDLVTRALARLQQRVTAVQPVSPRIVAGGLALDATTHTVTRDGAALNLTVTEFRLLHHLMARAGQVVATTDLLREIWEQTDHQDPDVLRVTLHRLRRKLGDSAANPVLLQTVPGVGIIFRPSADATPLLEPIVVTPPTNDDPLVDDRPRSIGSLEIAEPDGIRVKLVTDPRLEALLFALPGAALESFDADRFAATWRFPVAAPGAREVVEYARSSGLAMAIDDDILPSLAAAPKRSRPRRSQLVVASDAAAVSATNDADAPATAPPSEPHIESIAHAARTSSDEVEAVVTEERPSIAARLSNEAGVRAVDAAKATNAAARRAAAALPRAPRSAKSWSGVSGGGRITALFLLITGLVAFLSIGSQLAELTLLARVTAGEPVTASELVVSGSRQQAIAVALLAAYAATALRFLAWLHGRYARLRASRRTLYAPSWVVVSFFVPVANLYVPYRAVVELFRSGRSGSDPERSHLVVDLWWAAWLAFVAASIATAFAADRATLAQIAMQARLNIVADLLGMVAAALAAVVVVRLDTQLHQTPAAPQRDPQAAASQI